MTLDEAIYLIRSKEKMLRTNISVGSGHTKEYLQKLIDESLRRTKKELLKQAGEGSFTKQEALDVYKELSTVPVLETFDEQTAVATFIEYLGNELTVHSVAIRLSND
jgi:hypothetical protein